MTDRAAAFAALCSRITEAAAHHDLKDLLSADALREAADLTNSTDLTSDPPAALVLRTFHVLRYIAEDLAESSRWILDRAPLLPVTRFGSRDDRALVRRGGPGVRGGPARPAARCAGPARPRVGGPG